VNVQNFSVRPTTAADWQAIRGLRLEMIQDTPLAFAETLDEALACSDDEWRLRGSRGAGGKSVTLAAITAHGTWVGTMGAYVPDPSAGPLLVGVYVSPDWRGRGLGVTDALLAGIENRARTVAGRLTLHVHQHNTRALLAYASHGFIPTGHSIANAPGPGSGVVEMAKSFD
jgi:GNAT superfamily N-acetyltransferase